MQMTPHSYNVTTCASSCATLLYSYTNGSAFMNVSIGNLTSATEYSIRIAAFVVRRDSVTGGRTTLQSNPTDLQVKTDDGYDDDDVESVHDVSSVELSTEDATIDLIPEKTRGIS
ncbi:Hypothetical protein SMAX5B_010438 [Scophthalmus maximus]|nr:Hypothetical protein SMAX5B_010438 [Scophthalmus maximus]